MKLDRILFIIGTILVTAGILFLIAATVMSKIGQAHLSDLFFAVSSILGVLSLAVLIIRLVSMSRNIGPGIDKNTKVVVKVVDVKDIPKSKEQELYEQYEDLYKRNLITKEDLDLKRQELLEK